jgi:hypothetical protein
MPRHRAAAVLVLALAFVPGCSQALVAQTAVQDAQLQMLVKTALVNDQVVGVRPIEVTVVRGVVRLSGRVASDDEARQAVALAQSVPGVVEVRSVLVVGPMAVGESDAGAPAPQDVEPDAGGDAQAEVFELGEAQPNLLAVGASIRLSSPGAGELGRAVSLGPIVRLGSGSGFGPSIGFGWFGADLSNAASAPLGRLRIRPVLAGVGYTVRRDRVAVTFAVAGGVAFNSLRRQARSPGPDYALEVGNSPAFRANASMWFDVGARTALNVSIGRVMTRPRVTLLEGGEVSTRRQRADTTLVSAGLAYRLF